MKLILYYTIHLYKEYTLFLADANTILRNYLCPILERTYLYV